MTNQQDAQPPKTVKEAFDRAVDLHRQGDLDAAAPLYRLCLSHNPNSATAWTNYGALLRRRSQFAESIAAHRKALEIKPDNRSALSNLANALCDIGRADQAIALREDLLQSEPDNWERVRDLAVAYRGAWRNRDAVDLIDRHEARRGEISDICRLQRSLANLMLGEYAQGFADFEYRYAGDEVSLPENAPWPRWNGEPLAGKSIVILPEQGFGDAILMSRFLPALKAQGADISMVVKPPLQRLFADLDGLDHILGGASRKQHFDYYTPNMSLPHLVGFPDGTPPPLPKLAIPADSRARAARIVQPFERRFKIGVVWTGSLTYRANHRRSTGPDRFVDLATVPGVQLFSLYKGDAHDDFIASGMAGLILDACGNDRDFADTAALIDEMDLLITTDTAVVHVAASLGKPVWNMLAYEGFWLYGSGDKTPWYPSMRLFRQPANGDWSTVLARIEADLRNHLETLA